jgi:hypothetical protein
MSIAKYFMVIKWFFSELSFSSNHEQFSIQFIVILYKVPAKVLSVLASENTLDMTKLPISEYF